VNFDPLAPTSYQQKLFTRFKNSHKVGLGNFCGDHAAFMELLESTLFNHLQAFIDRFNE